MSSWISIAVFLVLTRSSQAIVWQDDDGGPISWAMDCNFEGNGTADKQLDTFKKCGNLCLETQNCDHFTWTNDQGGICMMKYSNFSIQSSDQFQKLALNQTESVCGYLKTSWNKDVNNTALGTSDWGYNCLVLGLDGGIFLPAEVTKKEECGVLCRNNSECNGFTWKPHNQWCLMTSGGYVSKDTVIFSPHGFCGVIDGRQHPNSNAKLYWLYILPTTFFLGLFIYSSRKQITNRLCPQYSI